MLFTSIFFITVLIQQMIVSIYQTQIYTTAVNLILNQCSFYYVTDYYKL